MSQLELPDLLSCSCSDTQKQPNPVDPIADNLPNQTPNSPIVSYSNDVKSSTYTSSKSVWANVYIVVGAYLLYKLMRNWR